jgi:DNA-binding transcriptional ArsR family regulator
MADTPDGGPAEPLSPELLQQTAATFGMLSATVRLHLLWLLAGGGQDVGSLAESTAQSVATVSHHLGKLKLAGLVQARRDGKRVIYTAVDSYVVDVVRATINKRLEPSVEQARYA